MKKNQKKSIALIVLGLLLIAIGILYLLYHQFYLTRFGVLQEDILLQVPADELPEDTLYITQDRRLYQRGAMTLIIPSIDVYTLVGESTLPEGLREMPGLYEFSQLPGEGDVNVSIAGHRDIHDQVFYHLDKVEEGDFAYLVCAGTVFQYQYRDTTIVEPTDWSVIQPQGFSCLTLTTCDPIGTTINRMILRAQLVDHQPYHQQYQFVANGSTNMLPEDSGVKK